MKIKAGALMYTVFLSFAVAALLMLFLTYRGMRLKYMESELLLFQKSADLNSALTLYLSYPGEFQVSDSVAMEIHNKYSSIVHVKRSSWGIFDIVKAKTQYKGSWIRKTILAGKELYRGDSIALRMPDNSQPVYASGNTIIKGNIKISGRGIQKAAIEGRPLTTEKIPNGRILPGEKNLPVINKRLVNHIRSWLDEESLPAKAFRMNSIAGPVIVHKNKTSPMIFISKNSFQLSNLTATGDIVFFSDNTIHVTRDTRLHGVIVSARKVIIEDGFEGNLQVFGRDSIRIGKDCHLLYPSSLVVYNEAVNPVYIELGESSHMEGFIVCIQTGLSGSPPYLKVHEGSNITGQVYHDGTVELGGNIFGSITCRSFHLQTRRAYYVNHLLDNEINFLKLPRDFIGIDFLNGYNDQLIASVSESFEKAE